MMIDFAECLYDVQAIVGEVFGNVDKISPAMGETVGQYSLELFGDISRESIAHLDRRREAVLSVGQHLGDIFAGVLAGGEKESNLTIVEYGENAGGEGSRSR